MSYLQPASLPATNMRFTTTDADQAAAPRMGFKFDGELIQSNNDACGTHRCARGGSGGGCSTGLRRSRS